MLPAQADRLEYRTVVNPDSGAKIKYVLRAVARARLVNHDALESAAVRNKSGPWIKNVQAGLASGE